VDVGINQAGKNGGGATILDVGLKRDLVGSDHVEDAAFLDEEGSGANGVRGYDALGNEGAESHRKERSRSQARESSI
jgi:hypothetical protein